MNNNQDVIEAYIDFQKKYGRIIGYDEPTRECLISKAEDHTRSLADYVEKLVEYLPGNKTLKRVNNNNGVDNTDGSETKYRIARPAPKGTSYRTSLPLKATPGQKNQKNSNILNSTGLRLVTYVPPCKDFRAFVIPISELKSKKSIDITFKSDGTLSSKAYADYEVPIWQLNKPIQ